MGFASLVDEESVLTRIHRVKTFWARFLAIYVVTFLMY